MVDETRGENSLREQLQSPHFFSMSGIPRFGKNWLDHFIPEEEMQNVFLTSEVVRNVLMLQCVYFASLYGDLLRYKLSFPGGKDTQRSADRTPYKVGIIGCGQLGTMLLLIYNEYIDEAAGMLE